MKCWFSFYILMKPFYPFVLLIGRIVDLLYEIKILQFDEASKETLNEGSD